MDPGDVLAGHGGRDDPQLRVTTSGTAAATRPVLIFRSVHRELSAVFGRLWVHRVGMLTICHVRKPSINPRSVERAVRKDYTANDGSHDAPGPAGRGDRGTRSCRCRRRNRPGRARRCRTQDPAASAFVADRGLTRTLSDLRAVVQAAAAGGRHRVVLGGHSWGATTALAYAASDFGGSAGHRDLSGLVLIDGGVHGAFAGGGYVPTSPRNGCGSA